jgi:hypothetical protein
LGLLTMCASVPQVIAAAVEQSWSKHHHASAAPHEPAGVGGSVIQSWLLADPPLVKADRSGGETPRFAGLMGDVKRGHGNARQQRGESP